MRVITWFATALFTMVVVTVTNSFGGNTPKFCNAYADNAVSQFNQAKQNNLTGIVPPVWSNDRNGHYFWCMVTPENTVNAGRAKRQKYLDSQLFKKTGKTGVATGVIGKAGKISNLGGIPVIPMKKRSYLGCYKDQQSRDLSGSSYHVPNMTTDSCLVQCRQKGFAYAGLQYGSFCYCGNEYGRLGKSSECNMPCVGNNQETCGGRWANSVYQVSAPASVAGAVHQTSKEEFCKKYSKNALRQFTLAQEHSLPGITPPVWSDDTKRHYEWCLKASKEVVTKGEVSRQSYLDKYIKKETTGVGMVTGIINKTAIPASQKIRSDRDSLRWAIANTDGGAFEVTPGTSFSAPKGTSEIKQLIDVPEVGLYKVDITLSYSDGANRIELSPRIDKEDGDYNYQLLPESPVTSGMLQKFGDPLIKAQKKWVGTFSPWIISDSLISASTGSPAHSEYYFWVDKEHLPANGQLQFRLQTTKLVNLTPSSHGEFGDVGYVPPVHLAVKDHAEIRGRFNVQYAAPYKAGLNDTFLTNGADVPFSIIPLPTAQQSGMRFSVIETPVLSLKGGTGSSQSPLLSFFLTNAERLSSQTSPSPPAPSQGLLSKKQNPNRWIYRDVLQKEYGQIKDCDSIALDGVAVCSKYKGVRYYSWDAVTKGYNGSLLYDISNPPLGHYYAVVSNNPVDGAVYSVSHFTTTGLLFGAGLIAGDDLHNEVVVATRNSAPMKWTYVAELNSVTVSEQAEYDSDDDDLYFGEFSLLASSILSESKGANQMTLRPDQIKTKTIPFPMVDNEDRPHNFAIRPHGNSGAELPGNAGGVTFPRLPIFVMDYEELSEKYNGLLLNVVITEHDKQTFWQRNGNVIKLFSDFILNVGKVAFAGVDPGSVKGLAKSIYSFATTELNPNVKVDDFMGNAALSVFQIDNYGLGTDNTLYFTITGPADSSYFDMQYVASKSGRASTSSSSSADPSARNLSATIKLRRVPQLHSRADIQLIDFTPVDSPTWLLLQLNPFMRKDKKVARDQIITEGLLSGALSSRTDFSFKNVQTGKVITVRTAQEPSWSSLNKGVMLSDEREHGRATMHSQSWDGKGFTYYQAELSDLTAGRFSPAATISLTLYHEDVIKNAGKKGYTWLDTPGDGAGAMGIISTKLPGRDLYKVDIKLRDDGDWLSEANLVAYVHVE